MKFGNGGTPIDAVGNVDHRSSNTDIKTRWIHINLKTYTKIVDVDDPNNTDATNNKVEILI